MIIGISLESTSDLAAWLKDHDLSLKQLIVLLTLRDKGPSNMSQIAAAADFSTAASTTLVDSFEKRGFVTRKSHPTDRRVSQVLLLPAAEKVLSEITKPDPKLKSLHETFSR